MGGSVSTVYDVKGFPEITNGTPLASAKKVTMGGSVPTAYDVNGFPEITNGTSLVSPNKKGQVIAFHSSKKLKHHLQASKQTSKLMVIDFTAAWCAPCLSIMPAVNEFAETYKDVEFIKIDVDELHDVAEEFGVQVMPTFILIKREKEVDKVVGAKRDDLQKKIEKHRF